MTEMYWVLSSSVLILAVIVIRALLGKRIGNGVRYALWGLVLLRLLIPGTAFHSRLSIASLTDRAMKTPTVLAAGQVLDATPVFAGTMRDTELTVTEAEAVHDGEVYKIQGYSSESGKSELHTYFFRNSVGETGKSLLRYLWYMGIAGTALFFTGANLRLYLRLRRRRIRLENDCGVPVYAVENLSSSCLFGRAIYVSSETAENDRQLRYVLAHEMAHYRHRDNFWPLLRCMAIALHWFNPLVWWAGALSRLDSELFADSGAIKALGERARMSYGEELIKLSVSGTKRASLLCTATMMTNGKKQLKERISHIARGTKTTLTIALTVMLVVCLAAGCAFAGADTKEKENVPEVEATEVPSGDEREETTPKTAIPPSADGKKEKYLRFFRSIQPRINATEIKDAPVYGYSLIDIDFDDNPEIILWGPGASASCTAEVYEYDGSDFVCTSISEVNPQNWRLSEYTMFHLSPWLERGFLLMRDRATGEIFWCVHSGNGMEDRCWGRYVSLPGQELIAEYDGISSDAEWVWNCLIEQYEILDVDYGEFTSHVYFEDRLSEEDFTALLDRWSAPDMSDTIPNLKGVHHDIRDRIRPSIETGDGKALLLIADEIPWDELTAEELNGVFDLLEQAATGDEPIVRDICMLRAAAKTDGAYSEMFFETLLPMQYKAEPATFLDALGELPEELYSKIAPMPFVR